MLNDSTALLKLATATLLAYEALCQWLGQHPTWWAQLLAALRDHPHQ